MSRASALAARFAASLASAYRKEETKWHNKQTSDPNNIYIIWIRSNDTSKDVQEFNLILFYLYSTFNQGHCHTVASQKEEGNITIHVTKR